MFLVGRSGVAFAWPSFVASVDSELMILLRVWTMERGGRPLGLDFSVQRAM